MSDYHNARFDVIDEIGVLMSGLELDKLKTVMRLARNLSSQQAQLFNPNLICALDGCDKEIYRTRGAKPPKYCSDAHRQKAYRERGKVTLLADKT